MGTYTPDDKLKAAAIYVVTGSQRKAATAAGCAHRTIGYWMETGDAAWCNALEKAQEVYDQEMPYKIAGVMDDAIRVVAEKLPDATASQAATVYGIFFDKRQIAMNRPTSLSGKAGDLEERLQRNAERLVTRKPKLAA